MLHTSTIVVAKWAPLRQRGRARAGATLADVKGKIVEFLWHLKKQGKTEATIKTYTAYVDLLNKAGANIFDPESTKLTIANYFKDRNTKRVATCAYDAFLGLSVRSGKNRNTNVKTNKFSFQRNKNCNLQLTAVTKKA